MTNEELNKAVYDKMSEKRDEYRDWLMTLSPEKVLKNAYEYAIYEDILLSLEDNELEDDQALALLNMEDPLRQAFNRFDKLGTDHMEYIWNALEYVADNEISREQEELRKADAVEQSAPEYERAEIFGIPALFADERINAADAPEGLYRYDLRGSDDDPGRPAVENYVAVNHAGTLITAEPLDIPKDGFLPLTEENGLDFLGKACTIQEFCDEQKQNRGAMEAAGRKQNHTEKRSRNAGKSDRKRVSRER